MKVYSFEKLEVWQLSRMLTKTIYQITIDFPDYEKYGLANQMRRAAISIPSNIAEGTSRSSIVDQARFYEIAYGSLMELLNQAIIANDLQFISDEILVSLRNAIDPISFKLTQLKKAR